MVILTSIGFIGMAFLIGVYGWFLPRGNIFLSELIPIQYYYFFPFGLVISLFHSYQIAVLGVNLAFTCSLSMVYLFYLCDVLTNELTLGRTTYRTSDDIRSASNLCLNYRALQVLNANSMSVMGRFVVYLHSAMMLIPINLSFNLIAYWSEIGVVSKSLFIFACIVAFCFWTMVLQFGKVLDVRGEKLLTSWQRMNWDCSTTTKYMNKFRKSCQLILLRHEKVMVVKRITQFLYIKGVVRGTFRFLLTLSRK